MPGKSILAACALYCAATACLAAGRSAEEDELALAYGDQAFVTIATGTRMPVTRAPAVASVITAEEIAAMGATDLDEVLETVPGLHVARGTQALSPVYQIRGMHRDNNPQVLMLMNGVPVTSVFQGNRGNVWAGFPVENIARIEVIRGPGSALYGADAFSGVISITTKAAADIDGTQFGLRAGSFGSHDAWVLHGGSVGALEVAAYMRIGGTDGYKKTVEADAQSGYDRLMGTRASHAPGPLAMGRDSLDGGLDLAYGDARLRVGYKQRDRVESTEGVAQALDPTGRNSSERITTDFSYRNSSFRHWDVGFQAAYLHYKEFSDLVLFPAGANIGTGVFADGIIGNPYKWEQHGRANASALYSGFESHRVRLGAGVQKENIYRTRETKNFNPDFTPIGTGSVADVTDVSDTVVFLRPHSRIVRHFFIQDEWNLAKDWTLTAGLRRDYYSDVGNTTNPRLALVWEAAYDVTAKLLYGTAFRAPSFTELHNINNPVKIGNPDLKPEKMRMLEAALSWQPSPRLRLGANVFGYRVRDAIGSDATNTYQNSGGQTGRGMELEATWNPVRELGLTGSFSHQESVDKTTNRDAGNAPHDRLYLRADWRFTAGWALNAQLNSVGDRQREPGDARGPLRGYKSVDITLRTEAGKGWNFVAAVRNLLDVDAREPSPYGVPFVPIPNDFPLPGRWFYVQATHSL